MPPTTSTGFRLDDGQIEVVDPFVAKCLRERTFAELSLGALIPAADGRVKSGSEQVV